MYRYLHDVYIWLGHPPGHRWLKGSICLAALGYLFHNDPGIQFWDHRDGAFTYMPNCWDGNTECSLSDLKHHLLAYWHVGHFDGEFCLLSCTGTHFRTLPERIEQSLRLQYSPLANPPRLSRLITAADQLADPTPTAQQTPPATLPIDATLVEDDLRLPFQTFDEWLPSQCHVLQPLILRPQLQFSASDGPSSPSSTGGGGDVVHQHITCTQGMLTVSIALADLALLPEAPTRTALLEHLPIRLSTRCTRAQSRATPGDGYCGLHALLRLDRHMGPEDKQKRDLPALLHLATTSLIPRAQSDEWLLESAVPSLTRDYLDRVSLLLAQGAKMADSVDHMPIEAMQLLIH